MIFNLITIFNLCLGIFCLWFVIYCIVETFHRVLAKDNCAAEAFLMLIGFGYLFMMNIITSMKYLLWLVKGGI